MVDAVAAAVRPGATGADLLAAALAVETEPPWLRHLYLVHGLGQHSSEAPLIGTAGGAERERTLTLVEGMVLVIEPSIRDEGCGPGYRAEEVVVVTATGCESVGERVEEPFR